MTRRRRLVLGGVTCILSAGLVVASASPAAADNCGTFSDCFGTADAASTALLGMIFLVGLSILIDLSPLGRIRGAIEAVTGRDLLTGDELSPAERLLGIVPGGRTARSLRGAGQAFGGAGMAAAAGGMRRPNWGAMPHYPRHDPSHWQRRWYSPGQPMRHTPDGRRTVQPSRAPSPDNTPGGRSTEIPPRANRGERQDLESENRSAQVIARHGFDIRQNPPVPPNHPHVRESADPDYLIEGRYFDNKAPRTSSVRNIASTVNHAIDGRQAEGVVLDLSRSRVDLAELHAHFRTDPPGGEVWVRYGDDIVPFFP